MHDFELQTKDGQKLTMPLLGPLTVQSVTIVAVPDPGGMAAAQVAAMQATAGPVGVDANGSAVEPELPPAPLEAFELL